MTIKFCVFDLNDGTIHGFWNSNSNPVAFLTSWENSDYIEVDHGWKKQDVGLYKVNVQTRELELKQ